MKSLSEQMAVYHQYHKKLITKLTHFVGVPMIVFSLMIVLNWIQISVPGWFEVSAAWLVLGILCFYYLFLDIKLALGMVVVFAVMNLLTYTFNPKTPNLVGLYAFLGCFIGGWIIQLIGHVFEGKKPALVDNLFQIFIAPIFLLAEALFAFGFYQDLKKQVEGSE